jgi:nucleoside diphosphate kinase
MSMREKFTKAGCKIQYYAVQWEQEQLSWADFRGKVLGGTDPAEAPEDSLRGIVMKDWEALGLAKAPDVGDNGVHASASPFEAMAERVNWMSVPLEEDAFGQAMLSAGFSHEWIKAGCVDPQISLGDGSKGSLYDAVEDMDATECLNKMSGLTFNQAFVFIKPHAVTDKVKECVKKGLEARGITILAEGEITGEVIDEKKLIDQHYYSIASKATILKPEALNVPEDKFETQFGLTWKDALAAGNVYNALDGCAKLEIDGDEMDKQWGICKKAKKLVKFGGGFYCGLIEIEVWT